MNTSPETPVAEPGSTAVCLTIKSGRSDCHAHFYPALYQLTLVRGGVEEKIDLGYSGSRLLERLLQQPGEVVSRDELMNYAWADRVVGQGSLNQQIYTLRQVLGDEKSREIIQTLPRRGYLLNPSYLVYPSSSDDSDEADDRAATSTPARPFLRHHARRRGFWLVLLGALILLGSGLFTYLYQFSLPTRLYRSELQLGQTHLLYADRDEAQLQRLILDTNALARRLAELDANASSLALGMSSDFYQLLCMQPDGGVRSLMFHHSQLDRLADAQLRRCLP